MFIIFLAPRDETVFQKKLNLILGLKATNLFMRLNSNY